MSTFAEIMRQASQAFCDLSNDENIPEDVLETAILHSFQATTNLRLAQYFEAHAEEYEKFIPMMGDEPDVATFVRFVKSTPVELRKKAAVLRAKAEESNRLLEQCKLEWEPSKEGR